MTRAAPRRDPLDASTPPAGPVVTGWRAVSPFGARPGDFAEGLRIGRAAAADTDSGARLVPGFTVSEALGRKGTRSMDRITGLAVTAVGQLLDAQNDLDTPGARADLAVVLGVTAGSVQSAMEFTRSSLLADKPFYVDPGAVPNSVMNCAAGHAAIWHGITGPNATVAGGRLSGLLALRYARRLLRAGRARAVVCGAVEEHSDARAWLERHSRPDPGAVPDETVLGEGCVVMTLRPPTAVSTAGARPAAELLAVDARVCVDGDLTGTITACATAALDQAGARPDQVWAAAPSGPDDAARQRQRQALQRAGVQARDLDCAGLIGDTGAASAGFGLAAGLCAAEREPEPADRIVVVTAAERDGAVACGVLRALGSGAAP